MRRRHLFAIAAALLPAATAPRRANAAPARTPFTPEAFRAAQAAGRPIVVHVEASWCPTCAKQRPIIARLLNDPAFASLTLLDVDFDAQKDVVRQFAVQMQSTLIAFHGATETARSVGDTHEESIRALLGTAVAAA